MGAVAADVDGADKSSTSTPTDDGAETAATTNNERELLLIESEKHTTDAGAPSHYTPPH